MKLEVGKTYRTRSGNKVKIILEHENLNWTYRFEDENCNLYREDGHYVIFDNVNDIIKEDKLIEFMSQLDFFLKERQE